MGKATGSMSDDDESDPGEAPMRTTAKDIQALMRLARMLDDEIERRAD